MISTPAHAATYSDENLKKAREAMVPTGRIGNGKDIADAVIFLASDGAGYINGANLPVDGGITKSHPRPDAGTRKRRRIRNDAGAAPALRIPGLTFQSGWLRAAISG